MNNDSDDTNLPAEIESDNDGAVEVFSPVSVFDLERYEQINRVAVRMAAGSLIPDHIRGDSLDEAESNCFLICNVAANWGVDPFAVASASGFVYKKLVFEGKLVRTVIRKKLGFDLWYRYFGNPGDANRGVYVSDKALKHPDGRLLSEEEIEALMEERDIRITKGTFAMWATKKSGNQINDNWAGDERKMFRERGSREWCREWEPAIMLGVYTPDEFDEAEHTSRSNRAKDVTAEGDKRNPLAEDTRQPVTEPKTETTTTTETPKSEAKPSAKAGPAADPPPSAAPPAGTGVAGGEGDTTPYRLSAEEFRAYHSALQRMDKPETVKKAREQFWKDHRPPMHADDAKLCKDLLENHVGRTENKIPPDLITKSLEDWIAAVINGGEKK